VTCEIFLLRINCSFNERHQKGHRTYGISKEELMLNQKRFNIPMTLQWMSGLYIEAFLLCKFVNSLKSMTKTLTLRKYAEIFCPTNATPKKGPSRILKQKKQS